MNIYISFLQSKNSYNITGYSFWENYIKNGILESGDYWFESNDIDWVYPLSTIDELSLSNWKARTWDKVLKDIRTNKIDIFLSYLYPSMIDTNAIKEIQKLGIPCVNFYCDNIRSFKDIPETYSVFDLNWVPEYEAIQMYERKKYPCLLLPMPMWVPLKYRNIISVDHYESTFVGTADRVRLLFFNELFKKFPDINVEIYGNGWNSNDSNSEVKKYLANINLKTKFINQIQYIRKFGLLSTYRKITRSERIKINENLKKHIHSKIPQTQYFEILRESKISIGINRYDSFDYSDLTPNKYSRLRDIEAPMLGACYLTEYAPGLEYYYDINNEISVYNDIDEFYDKITFLSRNKELRYKYRVNAQQKALNELSLPSTFKKIKQYLNLNK